MKNTKISRWFAVLLSAAILVSCMCIPALAAADASSINPDEKGSISVTMKSGDTTATDGTLTLYQVATLNVANDKMSYTKTEDFAGFEGDLDVDDTALAGDLASYVEENGLTGTEAKVSSEGEVSFEDLTLGLYLLIQTGQSTGFYTIDPVLVTVPIAENNEWVYNVDASPKVQVTPEPGSTETMSIPVKVIWDDLEDADAVRPSSATVVLEGTDGSARSAVIVGTDIDLLSAGSMDTELSVSTLAYVAGGSSGIATLATTAGSSWDEDDDWDYIFEDLPIYDRTGAEIHYTLYEEPIEDYSISIDGDEYTGFFVTNYHQPADNGGTTSPSPSEEPTATEGNGGNGGSGTPGTTGGTGSNGGNGGTSRTSGTSGNGGTTKTLPQTGQLNWPVALFAVLGVIFVVVGIVLVNTGRKRRSET